MGDPTAGLVAVAHNTSVLLHGGRAADALWELCLPTLEWLQHRCVGEVPPPRIHHAGGVFTGHLIVCGGEDLRRGEFDDTSVHGGPLEQHQRQLGDARRDVGVAPRSMPYYELNLDTLSWHEVPCGGNVPQSRSHHSATVVRGNLVVVGGKSPSVGGASSTTVGHVSGLLNGHFYDAYILDIVTRTWRAVDLPAGGTSLRAQGPRSPAVWGHSAVAFNDRYVICHGGMDVGSQPPVAHGSSADDEPAAATLSDTVHILDMDAGTWSRCTSPVSGLCPSPRACHSAVCLGVEMVIMNGFTVNSNGQIAPLADSWIWNIESGEWAPMEPSAPFFTSVRPPVALYFDQIVLLPALHEVHFSDLRYKAPWQRVTAAVNASRNQHTPSFTSPFDTENVSVPRGGALGTLPDSADRFMREQVRKHAHGHTHEFDSGARLEQAAADRVPSAGSPPRPLPVHVRMAVDPWAAGAVKDGHVVAPPPRDEPAEVARLRAEVTRLQQLAGASDSARASPDRGSRVVSYGPGRNAVVPGPSLSDIADVERRREEPAKPPKPAPSFVDKYIREADRRAAASSPDPEKSVSRLLLRTTDDVRPEALPDSLRELRAFQKSSRAAASSSRVTQSSPARSQRARDHAASPRKNTTSTVSATFAGRVGGDDRVPADPLGMLPSGRDGQSPAARRARSSRNPDPALSPPADAVSMRDRLYYS